MLLALCVTLPRCWQLPLRNINTLNHLLDRQSTLPAPPPLVRAPVQLSMPFHVCSNVPFVSCTTNTRSWAWETDVACHFCWSLWKVTSPGVRVVERKVCVMSVEKFILPRTIYASCTRNLLHLTPQERRNVYYHACKACVLRKCENPKVRNSTEIIFNSYAPHHGRIWTTSVKQCWVKDW